MFRNALSGLVIAVCWLSGGSDAAGMEFRKKSFRGGIAIETSGVIRLGDAEKFARIASHATVDGKGFRRIVLNSPGGNVREAMRIGKIIRELNFVTLVFGRCASACAMILYPAGRHFMLMDGGKLGFHSCYRQSDFSAVPECNEDIANFAAENGFPHGSIKVFASLAGPKDMHYVSNVLAYCYGMEHLIGDPAPISVSTLCPKVVLALIAGKFHEVGRPIGPSFDCLKASEPVEFLLCRDDELMQLDSLMGKLYRMIRRKEGYGKTKLLQEQRAWIADRDKKCPTDSTSIASREASRNVARCISERTMVRMNELLEINGTPRLDISGLLDLLSQKGPR